MLWYFHYQLLGAVSLRRNWHLQIKIYSAYGSALQRLNQWIHTQNSTKKLRIYNETYSSVPNVLTLEKSGKASYYILDYQYYGKWKLKGKTVTFTLEDSKSVVEGANDLLPAGSTIKFKIDKKNMRITREFEPRGVFVYERNH